MEFFMGCHNFQAPLLTWINLNSSMDKYKVWDDITYPFPNFNGCTVQFGNG